MITESITLYDSYEFDDLFRDRYGDDVDPYDVTDASDTALNAAMEFVSELFGDSWGAACEYCDEFAYNDCTESPDPYAFLRIVGDRNATLQAVTLGTDGLVHLKFLTGNHCESVTLYPVGSDVCEAIEVLIDRGLMDGRGAIEVMKREGGVAFDRDILDDYAALVADVIESWSDIYDTKDPDDIAA